MNQAFLSIKTVRVRQNGIDLPAVKRILCLAANSQGRAYVASLDMSVGMKKMLE